MRSHTDNQFNGCNGDRKALRRENFTMNSTEHDVENEKPYTWHANVQLVRSCNEEGLTTALKQRQKTRKKNYCNKFKIKIQRSHRIVRLSIHLISKPIQSAVL